MYLIKPVKGNKYNQKMFFSSKWATYRLTMLLCCFEAFLGKFTGNFSFYSKKWLSEIEAQKYSESLFFSTSLKRGKSSRKFVYFKQLFLTNQKEGANIKKKRFSTQSEYIELKDAFVLFWSIFEIFTDKKEAQNYSESLFVSTSLKRSKSRRKFGFFKQMFII